MKSKIMKFLALAFGYGLGKSLSNVAEGTHKYGITKLTDAAFNNRFLLGKVGSDAAHVNVCGANDLPMYIVTDECTAAEEPLNCQLLGAIEGSCRMVASGTPAVGAELFTAALGKVSAVPTVPGTYYRVGRVLTAPAADGEVFEAVPYSPTAYIVT